MSILRTWKARTDRDRAPLYERYFADVVLPRLGTLPGFLGAYLLRRELGREVELAVQTLWASRAAVEGFAGADIDVAVVDADAEAMLTSFDATVVHYDILIDTTGEHITAKTSPRSAE